MATYHKLKHRSVIKTRQIIVDSIPVDLMLVHSGNIGTQAVYSIFVGFESEGSEICREDKKHMNMSLATAVKRLNEFTNEDVFSVVD